MQVDRIRRYVVESLVDPARGEDKVELTICAGEVCRALGLNGRAPNVCSVLSSRTFLDMAGLKLLDRVGPRQSTTTTFRYALVGPGGRVGLTPGYPKRSAEKSPRKPQPPATAQRGKGANDKLTIVIACAGTKAPSAGYLTLRNGGQVQFVAHPQAAPAAASMNYSHPDDIAYAEVTWRQMLVEYNRASAGNPLQLLPAWRLYQPPQYPKVYSDLVQTYGIENIFILSAGWGLVSASFLLPNYDITFTWAAESYKQRKPRDRFQDFAMLQRDTERPVVFLGGKSYVPLFCDLTRNIAARRFVFHYSAYPPTAPHCELRRFQAEDAAPRSWYYRCAYGLIRGQVSI